MDTTALCDGPGVLRCCCHQGEEGDQNTAALAKHLRASPQLKPETIREGHTRGHFTAARKAAERAALPQATSYAPSTVGQLSWSRATFLSSTLVNTTAAE